MEGQDWINRKKDMFQTEKKKMGGKFSVPTQGVTKGSREEVVKHLKLKKTQHNQLNSRGAKMVRTALGKEKLDGNDVVTPGIGFFRPVTHEEEEAEESDIDVTDNNTEPKVKKVTLKERRAKLVTKKLKITNVHKKTFKEAFNADKTRLDKRQIKFDREQDFLILVKDNIHEKVPGGAQTAGKYLVYGKGRAKDMFLNQGLKYTKEGFYMHSNNQDFREEEVMIDTSEVEEVEEGEEAGGSSEVEEIPSPRKTQKLKNNRPRKVLTPGLYKLSSNQEEEEEEQDVEDTSLMEPEEVERGEDSEEGMEREVYKEGMEREVSEERGTT